ncbi:MAG: TolC family protein [Flavobacteriales bacterium]
MKQQMKQINRSLLLIIIGLVSPAFFAQQGTSFTLQEAVVYGVAHQVGIQKSKLELAKNEQKFNEALALYLPQVRASGGVNNNLKLATNIIPGAVFGQPGQNVAVKFGTKYTVNGFIDASQVIYDQSLITGLSANKELQTMTQLTVNKSEEQVIFDVAMAYYNVQLIGLQKEIVAVNVQKLDSLLKITKVQLDLGFAKQLDYDKLKVNRTNLETELANIELNYQQQLVYLKYVMAYPLDDVIQLTTNVENEKVASSISSKMDVTNNLDFQLLMAQRRMTNINISQLKMSYLPSFSLGFRYGYQAQRNQLDFLSSATTWYPNSVLSINMNVPIFDGLTKHAKIQQLNIQQKQSLLDEEQLKNTLNFQMKNMETKLQVSLGALETQRNNLQLAEEIYQTTTVQYQSGFISTAELLNAETSLKEAQTNYLRSIAQIRLAELEALKAAGNIKSIIK